MKRKRIFLFTITLLLLSNIAKASYAYYEEPEQEINEYANEETSDNEEVSESEDISENEEEILANRLNEEEEKLQMLSENINLKIPLEKELEANLIDEKTDSLELSQSSVSRGPAIKDKDQLDTSNITDEEETKSLFTEESNETDEVSLSSSALQKSQIIDSSQYRTRKVRSR